MKLHQLCEHLANQISPSSKIPRINFASGKVEDGNLFAKTFASLNLLFHNLYKQRINNFLRRQTFCFLTWTNRTFLLQVIFLIIWRTLGESLQLFARTNDAQAQLLLTRVQEKLYVVGGEKNGKSSKRKTLEIFHVEIAL